jgi:hypothetical protein
MRAPLSLVAASALLSLLFVSLLYAAPARAYSAGQTGKSTTGCANCHGTTANAAVSATFGATTTTLAPGELVAFTFTVGSSSSSHSVGGFNVSATSGTLGAATGTRVASTEVTHSNDKHFSGGSATFDFTWTAPSAEGVYQLRGAGLAGNHDNASTGDGWALATSLNVTVDDGCDDLDLDGYEACLDGSGEDCDDDDDTLNPGEVERCDGLDNDCDGAIDGPDAVGAIAWYADLDLDGYGDPGSTLVDCDAPVGYLADGSDCDDSRASVSPEGAEQCDSLGLDEDCDGLEGDLDPDASGKATFYEDSDGDGYGDDTRPVEACAVSSGLSAIGGDCDDADVSYNPAALESCADPADYNCDGSVGYADADSDGYAACVECDDQDALVSPEGTERCNGADDDCDGVVDEADAADAAVWFIDEDGDGAGSPAAWVVACAAPEGYAATPDDCDDQDAGVRPDAPESWYDGVDQDCDGRDDDQDGDGFPLAVDCDDLDPAVHPGALDAPYDDIDADCDGASDHDADGDGQDAAASGGTDCDDADPQTYAGAPDTAYDGVAHDCDATDEYDVDGDGYDISADCDDHDPGVYPGAVEQWYDGVDQDCDLNDDDQDGDGLSVVVDCDDEDAAALLDCGADGASPDGKGCASAPLGGPLGGSAGGWGAVVGALGAWALRRRRAGRGAAAAGDGRPR